MTEGIIGDLLNSVLDWIICEGEKLFRSIAFLEILLFPVLFFSFFRYKF